MSTLPQNLSWLDSHAWVCSFSHMARYAFWSSWPNVPISECLDPKNPKMTGFSVSLPPQRKGELQDWIRLLGAQAWFCDNGTCMLREILSNTRRHYMFSCIFINPIAFYNIISNILFVFLPDYHLNIETCDSFVPDCLTTFLIQVCIQFKSPGKALSSETNFSWITCQRPGIHRPISSPRFRFLLRIIELHLLIYAKAEVKW